MMLSFVLVVVSDCALLLSVLIQRWGKCLAPKSNLSSTQLHQFMPVHQEE